MKIHTYISITLYSSIAFCNCILRKMQISLILWKLWAFRNEKYLIRFIRKYLITYQKFIHFQQFFHHNFRLKWKFWNLMVPSERSSSDLSEYTLFEKKLSIKINFRWKMKNFRIFETHNSKSVDISTFIYDVCVM